MGGRARHALTAAALAAMPAVAAGQNPSPAAARDTLVPQEIFNDVFTPGAALPGYAVLSEGVVYRVEIQPAQASISFRVRRHPTLPPLLMVPLSGEAAEQQTASWLIVPRASEEYRIDVAVLGDEPVRLRIWSDPKEMSRYARMRQSTRNLPTAGLGLKIGYVGPFARLPRPYPHADAGGTASATGAELCLGVVPRGSWSYGALGGCALQLAYYSRPPDGNALFFTVAPRFEITPPASDPQVSLAGAIGLGTTLSVSGGLGGTQTYFVLGLGVDLGTPVARHVWLDLEAELYRIEPIEGAAPVGGTTLVPHLAAGLQYRF